MCRQGQINYQQIEALTNPIRFRIMELFAKDAERSLAIADLIADLGVGFEGVSASQVNYHLRELQRVELIPVVVD